MTRASAKKIVLEIVKRWCFHGVNVSGSLNGYRVMGTHTGRMSVAGHALEVNRNGDAFAPGAVLDLSNHPEVVAIRHDLNEAWANYAMHDAELTFLALTELSMRTGRAIITTTQQPVLREGNE